MSPRTVFRTKHALFTACLLPLADLLWRALAGELGANPVEALTRGLGDWALRLLLLTLALSPLADLTGSSVPRRLRRLFGLFAFFYASLHLLSYVVLDQFFDWAAIGADLWKRPFITVGMASFLLLMPLAMTSTDAMVRRLGGRSWKRLHRLVFPAAIGAVVHYYMLVKADPREPLVYAGVLLLLLGWRTVRGPGVAWGSRRAH